MVDVATIPGELFRRLAQALARGVEDVRRMLDGPPAPEDGAVPRAGVPGMAGAFAGAAQAVQGTALSMPFKVDFAGAVRASQLPDDMKRRWLSAT
jgi:hypothetical protein